MEIKKDLSCGVIPVYKKPGGIFIFCLVKHQGGHWGFPKGHSDLGESEQQTATRELAEETGINRVNIVPDAVFSEEYSFEQDTILYNKSVKYFLGFVSDITTSIPNDFKEEISELKWVTYEDAKEVITFKNSKSILDKVYRYLQNLN